MIACVAILVLFAGSLTVAAVAGRRLANPADREVTFRDRGGLLGNVIASGEGLQGTAAWCEWARRLDQAVADCYAAMPSELWVRQ